MSERDHTAAADRTHAVVEGNSALYVARQSGLYRREREDGVGRNLYQSWQPDQAVATMAVALSPDYDADRIIVAGINGGVARSIDGGEHWEALPFRSPPPLVTCLALSPSFTTDGVALAGAFEDGIFRSEDGGRSWRAFNFGLFDHNVYCLALSPRFAEDKLAFVGTSSGIYRSENGGRFWQDLPMPSTDETVLSLALSPQFNIDRTLFAGTEAHGLLRSNDGGASWQRLNAPAGAVNVVVALTAADGSLRLAAQIDESAYVSGDNGVWREIAAADVHVVAAGRNESLLLGLADGSVQRVTL